MKKLFGILLALAVAIAIALPTFAAEEEFDVQVKPNVTAPAFEAITMRDETKDEETGETIYGPEWTYYSWTIYAMVDIVKDGEELTVPLDGLGHYITSEYGMRYFGGIQDSQSAETPWQIGGTYDARYYLFDEESRTEVWSVDLKVTLTEAEAKVQIGDIIVDELSGWMEQDKEGNSYKYYRWEEHGVLSVTIDGTEYKNIDFWGFQELLEEKYGKCRISYSYDGDSNFDDQWENPWKPGDTFKIHMRIYGEKEFLFDGEIAIKVIETNIQSITAAPMTYYAHEGSGRVELTSHYKDGASGPCLLKSWYFTAPTPDEPGTYTATIRVADTFDVPVQITVLPTPTSGKLGDNVNWFYDVATKTLTVSGTGDTYFAGMTPTNFTEEFNEWMNSWNKLIVYHLPKTVVVEEGVTGLMPGFLLYAPSVESLRLPNSLQDMPALVFGLNGPTTDIDIGLGYATDGLSTIVVPQSVKTWNELSFYQCWGVKDIYLPAEITAINLENLVYTHWIRTEIGLEKVNVRVHFAGTEEQWNAINFFVPTEPSELTGSGTGLTLDDANALMKTVEIIFNDAADTYVGSNTVTVPDEIVKIEEGKDVVIEILTPETEPGQETPKVDGVVIGSATVDKIVEAETKVEIKLPEVTVSFDKTAMGSIGQQAADKDVTIVATEVKTEELNEKQQTALEEKAVYTVLNLEAKAGDEKITEFGGGKVTISVAFELPEGTIGTDFVVGYVADDGTITLMPTKYADGVLSFETTHFSNYVVLAVSDNPKTGDTSMSAVVALLVLSGAACVTLCANKRRLF